MASERGPATSERLLTRDFLVVTMAFLLCFLSFSAYFLLPRFFSHLGAEEGLIGVLMGIGGIASGVTIPLVGMGLDRFGRRPFLLLGALGLIASNLGFALTHSLWLLGAIRMVHGMAFASMFVSAATLVVDYSPETRRAQALAVAGVAALVSDALGPAIGEQLVLVGGFDLLFYCAASMGAVAFIPGLMIAEPARTAPSREHWPTWAMVLTAPILSPVLLAFVVGCGFGAMINFAADFTTKTGLVLVAPLLVPYAIAAIVVRLVGGRIPDRMGHKRVVIPTVATYAVGLVLAAWAWSLPALAVAGLIIGFSHGLCYPSMNALALARSSARVRGRVMGLYTGAFNVGITSSAFFLGWLAEAVGYRWMYTVAGTIVMVSLLGFVVFDREPRGRLLPVREESAN